MGEQVADGDGRRRRAQLRLAVRIEASRLGQGQGPLFGVMALLVLLLAAFRVDWPTREQFSAVPWWAWLGGTLGAAYVATATFTGPRLGALLLLALTVGGQMIASIVVDHYGLLGFGREPVDATRLVGVALLLGGIFLIAR